MKYCWRSILDRLFYFVILLLIVSSNFVQAQPKKGDYFFPIRPGEINYLSGSMGEIRSNHFHAGIDIKTGGIEGLPVYAAADGFVSRIKISEGGYGNALYIQHPNNTTTVYAHLLNYNEKIGKYIRERQYKEKTFEIELFPDPEELPIKKAEVVGLSGNSGSSGGPHLHFEVRDHNQDVLNPLHFGFDEIKDKIPPSVDRIAFVPLNENSRINHRFSRYEYPLYRNNNTYTLNQTVTAYGVIGLQVLAYDRLDGAANKNGVSCIDVFVDGEEVFNYNLSNFSFSATRNILAHIDYKQSHETGARYQKLYVADGNELGRYKFDQNKGKLRIEPGKEYAVTVNLYDSYSNHSKINIKIRGAEPIGKITVPENKPSSVSKLEIEDTMLKITATTDPDNDWITVFSNNMIYDVKPAYQVNNQGVYLWNSNAGLPDSIRTLNGMIYPQYQAFVPSGSAYNFKNQIMDISFSDDALFDTLLLSVKTTSVKDQEFFTIGEEFIPLRKHIYVTLKPNMKYDIKEKTGVYGIDSRGRKTFYGGDWKGDNIRFGTRDFGRYTILADTVPPKITPAKVTPASVSFYISDALSGIKDYDLKVDGEWVLMNYDYKKNLIWSEKLDPTKPFKGELVLKVTDQSGNENIYQTNL